MEYPILPPLRRGQIWQCLEQQYVMRMVGPVQNGVSTLFVARMRATRGGMIARAEFDEDGRWHFCTAVWRPGTATQQYLYSGQTGPYPVNLVRLLYEPE